MRRKLCTLVLALILVLTCAIGFVACDPTTDEPADETPTHLDYFDFDGKTLMVWIGDSIAEGIVGPSPLSERENYAYYAMLGKGFRSEETAGVDFRSCNVGVNINTTGHDGLSGCVNDFCISADGVDNLAVLDADIHLLCINSLSRVDYGTILDDILGHS